MADEIPTPGKAVYLFFEFIALGFVLEAIADIVHYGGPWYRWCGSLAMAALFLWIGVKGLSMKASVGKFGSVPIMVVLTLVILAGTGYDFYDRHHPGFGYDPARAWDDAKPLESIYNPHYVNQTVFLDGKHFINPVFDNVTLIYQGIGGLQMDNPKWILHDGKMTSRVGTRNKIVATAFLVHCGLVQANGFAMQCTNMGPSGSDIPIPKRVP